MTRRPKPTWFTTALPTLAALGACTTERHVNPPPTERVAQAQTADAAVDPVAVPPDQPLDPAHLPPVPLAGAPMVVTPMPAPQPSPAPAPMAPRAAAPAPAAPAPMAAGAPMAAASAAPAAPARAPGVYITHNHPPGTPCHPISQTEIQQAMQRVQGS